MTTKTVEMSLSEMIGALLEPVIVSRPRYRCDKGLSPHPRSPQISDLARHAATPYAPRSHSTCSPICTAKHVTVVTLQTSPAPPVPNSPVW